MFGRISLCFIVVSLAAFFCTQSVEAAKGPKITQQVYFDIKHGDKDLGRGMLFFLWYHVQLNELMQWLSVSLVVYVPTFCKGQIA